MKKHEEMHDSQCARNCHYFNNRKPCPFEELGCMFLHEEARICKHGESCSKNLCSYKHGISGQKSSEIDDKSESENAWECQVCDFSAALYNDYWDHIDNNHLDDDES